MSPLQRYGWHDSLLTLDSSIMTLPTGSYFTSKAPADVLLDLGADSILRLLVMPYLQTTPWTGRAPRDT
jgi:hypothetical protein